MVHLKAYVISISARSFLASALLLEVVGNNACGQSLGLRYKYAIFELQTLGGPFGQGWTLDNSGNVVGSAFLPGSVYHATVWNEAQPPTDLGTLGGNLSECRGINENGWIIGRAQARGQSGFSFSAFLWKNGKMMNLGYLPGGDESEAYGINNLGQIVGISTTDMSHDGSTKAFLWQDGEMTELDSPANYWSTYAIAINDSGLVAGQGFDNDWRSWRPVTWENGSIRDLGTFRSDNLGVGVAIGVNDAGDVVGYTAYTDLFHRAFLYHDHQLYALPMMPDWFTCYAWSINSHNQIVGAGRVLGNAIDDACIWERHQPVRYLNDLIPPYSNWRVNEALRNNDLGQITGTGYRLDDPYQHNQAYLITPIHQTIRLSRAQPGTAGVVNTLKVHGATPGARVTFIYGDKGGGSAIPGCTLEENALQIDSPIILATITANANGVAALRGYVPSGAQGRTVLIQAFVQNECGVSQLVVQRFE